MVDTLTTMRELIEKAYIPAMLERINFLAFSFSMVSHTVMDECLHMIAIL